MKRLLIATDFSPASDAAVEYGSRLAAALDAAITLVAAYEEMPVPVADTASITFIDAAAAKSIVEEGLIRQQTLFRQNHHQPIRTQAVKGPVVQSILSAAADANADLIITGMKTSGRQLRKIFGSTVTTLARKTHIPLLVIPEAATFAPPANILLGNDIRPDTNIHILDPLRELVALFSSKLYAVRVVQKGTKEMIEVIHHPDPLQSLDKTWNVKYEYPMGDDITGILNDFAQAHAVNMVVMLPHTHLAPERWFMRSQTRHMIFETELPLLILPE